MSWAAQSVSVPVRFGNDVGGLGAWSDDVVQAVASELAYFCVTGLPTIWTTPPASSWTDEPEQPGLSASWF